MVRVAAIGGDGIGPEVLGAGMRVLEAAAAEDPSLELSFTEFPWGCEYYLQHGRMMPEDALETLAGFDVIYLGAVGWPTVPDHVRSEEHTSELQSRQYLVCCLLLEKKKGP